MPQQIPQEIAEDIGAFLSQLYELGYELTDCRYDAQAFGNYHVDLSAGKSWLRIGRDRSQYFVDGSSKEQLRDAGMLRAFDDREAFEDAVLRWLAAA
jgi:hypothetical protein